MVLAESSSSYYPRRQQFLLSGGGFLPTCTCTENGMNPVSSEPLDVSSLANPTSRNGGPIMPGRKVVVIPLASHRQVSSQGSTAYSSILVGPMPLHQSGPFLQTITGYGVGREFTANFKWKLLAEKSIEGDVWSSFANPIIPEQTAQGMIVGNAYESYADFGLQLRFLLAVGNVSGTAIEQGIISAYVALKFWS